MFKFLEWFETVNVATPAIIGTVIILSITVVFIVFEQKKKRLKRKMEERED